MKRSLGIITAAIFSLSVIAAPVFAESQEELQQQLDATNQRKAEAQYKVDTTKNTIADIEAELTKADAEIDKIEGTIDSLDQKIDELGDNMAKTKTELAKVEKQEAEQEEALKERLRVMYMYGNEGYLEILFSSTDFADFIAKADMMRSIIEADKATAKALEDTRNTIQDKKDTIEQDQIETASAKEEQEEALVSQEDIKAQKNELIAKNQELVDSYEAEVAAEEEAAESIKADMDRLLAEAQARAEAEAAARAEQERQNSQSSSGGGSSSDSGSSESSGGSGAVSPSSGWTLPLPGNYNITSVYGWRIHPIFGEGRGHEGIDIGASSGTPIHAVGNGTVILSEYYGGYGECIILDMGNGYQTLYGHMSSRAVYVGQTVSQGDVIGYVGSTGWSTGPHLHFGVYSGSTSCDPFDFLPY